MYIRFYGDNLFIEDIHQNKKSPFPGLAHQFTVSGLEVEEQPPEMLSIHMVLQNLLNNGITFEEVM